MLDPSDYANSLARTVSDLVAQIEMRLIWEIARDVNRGLGGGSRYEVDMTARYGALYARLQRQLGKPWQNVLTTVQAALDKAAEAGQGMAERDLAGRPANPPPPRAARGETSGPGGPPGEPSGNPRRARH